MPLRRSPMAVLGFLVALLGAAPAARAQTPLAPPVDATEAPRRSPHHGNASPVVPYETRLTVHRRIQSIDPVVWLKRYGAVERRSRP